MTLEVIILFPIDPPEGLILWIFFILMHFLTKQFPSAEIPDNIHPFISNCFSFMMNHLAYDIFHDIIASTYTPIDPSETFELEINSCKD